MQDSIVLISLTVFGLLGLTVVVRYAIRTYFREKRASLNTLLSEKSKGEN